MARINFEIRPVTGRAPLTAGKPVAEVTSPDAAQTVVNLMGQTCVVKRVWVPEPGQMFRKPEASGPTRFYNRAVALLSPGGKSVTWLNGVLEAI